MIDNPATLEEDRARLTQWITQFGEPVRGYIFSITRNASVAEELTQETFCRVWQMRHRYSEQGTPKSYLFRVADRICIDYFRKNKRETVFGEEVWQNLNLLDDSINPVLYAENRENASHLLDVMKELSPAQYRVLTLRYFSQMGFTEIAEDLQMPINTVLSHAYRGLSALKKLFFEEPGKEKTK